MNHPISLLSSRRRSTTSPRARGNAAAPIVIVLVFIIIAALGILLIYWDGSKGQAQINENPPVGSVEGNLAQLANWSTEPIRDWIEANNAVPSDAQGNKALEELSKKPHPVFFPPTPVEPDGNPTYKKTNNGFEIVFPGRNGKPVICSFSSAGVYEGASGLGGFTDEVDSVKNPLEGVAP